VDGLVETGPIAVSGKVPLVVVDGVTLRCAVVVDRTDEDGDEDEDEVVVSLTDEVVSSTNEVVVDETIVVETVSPVEDVIDVVVVGPSLISGRAQ
jgi:hypothetical protein